MLSGNRDIRNVFEGFAVTDSLGFLGAVALDTHNGLQVRFLLDS